jgi:hypothetical protein
VGPRACLDAVAGRKKSQPLIGMEPRSPSYCSTMKRGVKMCRVRVLRLHATSKIDTSFHRWCVTKSYFIPFVRNNHRSFLSLITNA